MSRSDFAEVVGQRPLRLLILGVLAANLGAQVSFVAVATHLYALSTSTAVVGLTGLVTVIPMLALGLVGGALADRLGRRAITLTCQLVASAAAAVLAADVWWRGGSVLAVLSFAAIWAATIALSSPARISLIPVLAPPRLLSAANSVMTLVMTISWTAGPLLAAAVIDTWGYAAAYTCDVAFGLAALMAFWGVQEPTISSPPGPRPRVGDGLRIAASAPMVALALMLDLVAMVLCSPRVLFPAAASALYLGGSARTVGLLFAALAVGGLIGSVVRTPPGDSPRAPTSLVRMTAGWGAATLAFGLILGLAPQPPGLAIVACALVLGAAGLLDARATVVRQTLVQSHVDLRELGRIQGLIFVVGVASPRLGDLLMGATGSAAGVPQAAVAGGAACIGATVALVLILRRRADAATPVGTLESGPVSRP